MEIDLGREELMFLIQLVHAHGMAIHHAAEPVVVETPMHHSLTVKLNAAREAASR